jgi:hypothetical protein
MKDGWTKQRILSAVRSTRMIAETAQRVFALTVWNEDDIRILKVCCTHRSTFAETSRFLTTNSAKIDIEMGGLRDLIKIENGGYCPGCNTRLSVAWR